MVLLCRPSRPEQTYHQGQISIPVIDELLDELHGVHSFSKLDLRAGYHHILMDTDMSFGLTNAPSTFQALMNSLFREFLRKFVLVFFNDILIYSQSWEDHLLHFHMVFTILRDQQLFLKKSKCSFVQPTVGYFGHQVSREGVAVDNDKISAITMWPQPTSVRARGFLGLQAILVNL